MKITNIVINVVLAAAVIVLFVFQFSGDEKKEKGGEQEASAVLAKPNWKLTLQVAQRPFTRVFRMPSIRFRKDW